MPITSQQYQEMVARLKKSKGVTYGLCDFAMPSAPEQPKKNRIRQSSKPLMNKLETEFYQRIQQNCSWWIQSQTTKFRLGNGIWYLPDFFVVTPTGCVCYEVKGPRSFDGALDKLKVAASKYPEFRWILVWKEDGKWVEQVVLP